MRTVSPDRPSSFPFSFPEATSSYNSPVVFAIVPFCCNLFLASSPFPPRVLSSHSVPLLHVVDRFLLGTMNKGKGVLGGGTTMGPGLEMWCVMACGEGVDERDGRVAG